MEFPFCLLNNSFLLLNLGFWALIMGQCVLLGAQDNTTDCAANEQTKHGLLPVDFFLLFLIFHKLINDFLKLY